MITAEDDNDNHRNHDANDMENYADDDNNELSRKRKRKIRVRREIIHMYKPDI